MPLRVVQPDANTPRKKQRMRRTRIINMSPRSGMDLGRWETEARTMGGGAFAVTCLPRVTIQLIVRPIGMGVTPIVRDGCRHSLSRNVRSTLDGVKLSAGGGCSNEGSMAVKRRQARG